MPEIKLVAEPRTQFGKGAARKIRRDDKIPAVIYGHGAAPVHITLPGHDTMMALKSANALLSIELDGSSQLALAKDVQRDPIKPIIEHVDLVVVRRDEKVTVDVPVTTEGEAAAETVVTVDSQTVQLEVLANEEHIMSIVLADNSGWEELIIVDPKNVEESEHAAIKRLTSLIKERDPDVIEGHDLFRVDLPFIVARAKKLKTKLDWGRSGGFLRSRAIARHGR